MGFGTNGINSLTTESSPGRLREAPRTGDLLAGFVRLGILARQAEVDIPVGRIDNATAAAFATETGASAADITEHFAANARAQASLGHMATPRATENIPVGPQLAITAEAMIGPEPSDLVAMGETAIAEHRQEQVEPVVSGPAGSLVVGLPELVTAG